MNSFKKFTSQAWQIALVWTIFFNAIAFGATYVAIKYWQANQLLWFAVMFLMIVILAVLVSWLVVRALTKPWETLWKAILHVSRDDQSVAAPQLEKVRLGRELITSLAHQVYDLASSNPLAGSKAASQPSNLADFVLDSCPLPLFALDASGKILFANSVAEAYAKTSELEGRQFDEVINLSFRSSDTLENWLTGAAGNSVTAVKSWDRARLSLADGSEKQCAVSVHYSQDNPGGFDYTVALFDIGTAVSKEDDIFGYLALAVHELRTPLTILRGYIEVFEEELDPHLTPEMRDFMHKMSISAQQLSAFISNILNVAKIEENQMDLRLHETDWSKLLPEICQQLEMRAEVRHKKLQYDIEPDLPHLGIDQVSMFEVISNLADNAIKYSINSDKIIIHAHRTADGGVDTSVQDFGTGMPANVIKNLFTKFYRGHQSRSQVSGSGLGLYLVKSIIAAHGGEIWVKSKEGEGSVFGFNLPPYSVIADKEKDGAITRQAHGWIKNHSLYRR